MLISEYTTVKWNSANIKHFTEKRYAYTKVGDEFTVKVEDLNKGSHSIILVKCDYCGNIIELEYKSYVHRKSIEVTHKDACKNCAYKKSADGKIELYRTSNLFDTPESHEKAKQTIKERYGVDNISQLDEIKEKIHKTMIDKYGEDAYKIINEKARKTMLEKYGQESLPLKGENHPNWKGGITPENQKERKGVKYNNWRKLVFARDKFTCQCCKCHNDTLQAHHILNWSDNKELRFNINNGITLCKNCHDKFHSIYGKQDNDKEQIEEFIANIDKGETTIETAS